MPLPPLIPIVIGVTGKRELGDKVDFVRERLQEALSRLEDEEHFPNTPLVLVTGLAKGADLLAAEVALQRPRWTVVGILPFKENLFLEDFAEEADSKWRECFERVLAAPPERFLLKVLNPLRSPSGEPYKPEDLHRTADNPVRRQHYEQVGLAIADRCSLLIAVMPSGEEPAKAKVGGTARIVQYKRGGKLDAAAREVVQISEEIALPEPLDGEVKGLVQIIDPDGRKVADMKGDQHYAWMTLKRIEAYNRRAREPWAATELPAAQQLFDVNADDPAGDYIRRLRRNLSTIQGQDKKRLTWSMGGLAVVFVVSVIILESYAKLDVRSLFPWLDPRWLFAGYVFTFLCGLRLVSWVHKNALPAHAEDYRGAAEAMRVQVEWWHLGLRRPKDRVDRYYLVGGEGHFAVLRSGIRAVIDAAVLLGPKPALGGQPLVLDLEKTSFWIPNQIDWFKNTSDGKHRAAIRWSSLAWYLFQLSVGVGVAIGLLMLLRELGTRFPEVQPRAQALVAEYRHWLPIFGLAAAALCFLWASLFMIWVRAPQQGSSPPRANLWQRISHWLWYRRLLGTRGTHSGKHGWRVAVPLGALLVPAGIAFLLGQNIEAVRALDMSERLSLVLMIVLAAASGAVRFVIERSALEAEAISYREALQRFKAARERALETRSKPGADAGTILEADQKLGLELGRVALAENEAWLRAHRQRPFEPVT